jgi:hypothetical protein
MLDRCCGDAFALGERQSAAVVIISSLSRPLFGVIDHAGRTLRTFTYPTIDSARKAARAWTVAYGNCLIDDKTGLK